VLHPRGARISEGHFPRRHVLTPTLAEDQANRLPGRHTSRAGILTTPHEAIDDRVQRQLSDDCAPKIVVLVDAATLREAERLIDSCEHCNPEGAEIPFDNILDRVTSSVMNTVLVCIAYQVVRCFQNPGPFRC
jgi:hypothetical protein